MTDDTAQSRHICESWVSAGANVRGKPCGGRAIPLGSGKAGAAEGAHPSLLGSLAREKRSAVGAEHEENGDVTRRERFLRELKSEAETARFSRAALYSGGMHSASRSLGYDDSRRR